MRFLRRLRNVALAAVAAVVVSAPLAGFTATAEKGPSFSFAGPRAVGMIVLCVGVLYALWLEAWDWSLGRRLLDFGSRRRGVLASSALVLRRLTGAEVRRSRAVRWGSLAILLGFLLAFPSFASRSWMSNLVEVLVFATIALGLNISMGMAGLLVLGHAAFWAVGAYTFTMLVIHLHWNFWFAFPAAGIAAALVGLVIGLPALRLRGDYLAIITLGFGEAIRWVFKNEVALTGGDAGIPGSEVPGDLYARNGWLGTWLWQPRTPRDCYWFALGLLVVCVVSVTLLTRSRWGRALFALREDETAAECMGINTVRVKLLAFTSSAMWAGLAGVVHPLFRGQITPQLFDFNASVLFVSMVVLGGLGSIPGSILGAAILFILPQVLRDRIPEIQDYRMLIFGAVLTAMMVVRPEGLLGSSTTSGADGEDPPEAEPAPEADAGAPA